MALQIGLSKCCVNTLRKLRPLLRTTQQTQSNTASWRMLSNHVCRRPAALPKETHICYNPQKFGALKMCVRRASQKKMPKEDASVTRAMVKGLTIGTILAIAIAVGARFYISYLTKKRDAKYEWKSTGTALIGGPWELTDLDGKPIGDETFENKWYLLYFGFTHCPDICPDELEKISAIMDELAEDKKMPKLQTVFVTVDPERDSPEVMRQYCEEFHKDLIGATGTEAEIEEVTRTFRVYYSKGPKDQDGDYIVDHTIICYLMDPNNEMAHYYTQKITKEIMKEDIRNRIVKEQAEKMSTFQQFLMDPTKYFSSKKEPQKQ